MARKPNAWGSISRFEGQATVFAAENGPCYRCLHPEPPPPGLVPSCAEAGVLGVLPGIIGTIQATEVIKLLLGIGEPLIGRFIIYDALRMRFRELKLARDPECAVCGDSPTILELKAYEGYCDDGRLPAQAGPPPGRPEPPGHHRPRTESANGPGECSGCHRCARASRALHLQHSRIPPHPRVATRRNGSPNSILIRRSSSIARAADEAPDRSP